MRAHTHVTHTSAHTPPKKGARKRKGGEIESILGIGACSHKKEPERHKNVGGKRINVSNVKKDKRNDREKKTNKKINKTKI